MTKSNEMSYPWETDMSENPALQKQEPEPGKPVIEKVAEPEPPADEPKQAEQPKPEDKPEEPKNELTKEEREANAKRYMHERVIGEFTKQELDVIQSTIAKDTNKEEFRLFVQTCVNMGLNPFLNHIYPIVFDGKNGRKLNIQISVEGIMFLARRVPGYAGVDVQLVHENDEFMMKRTNGILQVETHEFGLPRGKLLGAYAIAKRRGFDDVIVVMEKSEVDTHTRGNNAKMWNSYFNDMFKKHILKRAAKEQYGIEINEEPIETTPSVTDYSKASAGSAVEEKQVETGEGVRQSESQLRNQLIGEIYRIADDKPFPMDVNELLYEKFPNKTREELTLQELAALRKFAEFYQPKPEKQEDEIIDGEYTEINEQPKTEESGTEEKAGTEDDEYAGAFD